MEFLLLDLLYSVLADKIILHYSAVPEHRKAAESAQSAQPLQLQTAINCHLSSVTFDPDSATAPRLVQCGRGDKWFVHLPSYLHRLLFFVVMLTFRPALCCSSSQPVREMEMESKVPKLFTPHSGRSSLENLANEMLENIFDYLQHEDYKSLRLTCREFLTLATEQLFQEIRMVFKRSSLNRLCNIVVQPGRLPGHPRLAQHVKSLVYRADRFKPPRRFNFYRRSSLPPAMPWPNDEPLERVDESGVDERNSKRGYGPDRTGFCNDERGLQVVLQHYQHLQEDQRRMYEIENVARIVELLALCPRLKSDKVAVGAGKVSDD